LKAGGCLVQIIKDYFYQEADFAPGLTKWKRVLGDPIKVIKWIRLSLISAQVLVT